VGVPGQAQESSRRERVNASQEDPPWASRPRPPRVGTRGRDAASPWRRILVQPRLVVALLLIVGGVIWAALRGLHFYGVSPAELVYDLDQPPLLLAFVAAWAAYRGRRP
jgi:hypothetical protein